MKILKVRCVDKINTSFGKLVTSPVPFKEDSIIAPFLKRMKEQYKKITKAFEEKKESRLKNLIDETGRIFIQHHKELSNHNYTWQYGEWLTKLHIAFKDMENDMYKECRYWD